MHISKNTPIFLHAEEKSGRYKVNREKTFKERQSLDFTHLDAVAHDLGCRVIKNESMEKHTTFKVGGPCDRYIEIATSAQLAAVVEALKASSIPYMMLGNGSNLLVADKGIRGAVLMLSGEFSKIELMEDGESIICGGGVKLSTLCKFAETNSLTGIEFAYGIPGTVGGAVFMNAGAYGGEMKDVVRKVSHMDGSGGIGWFSGKDLDFSYRHSVYSGMDAIIMNAVFKLKKGDKAAITSKMEELMEKRRSKQPYDMPSAGSTFKRPEGAFAAALIEECGLKGRSVGGAVVSPKHAGFIVNNNKAKCKDVLDLIEVVKAEVFTHRGIALECEVRLVGEME